MRTGKHMLFAVLAWLAGCGTTTATPSQLACVSPKISVQPPVTEQTLRDDWAARFGALPRACDTSMGWALVSSADYAQVCGADTAGCYLENHGCPVGFAAHGFEHNAQLYAHEIAHWYLHCSGRVADGDHDHTLPEVWGAHGFVLAFAPAQTSPSDTAPNSVSQAPASATHQ
jgi:hypothetical protein